MVYQLDSMKFVGLHNIWLKINIQYWDWLT